MAGFWSPLLASVPLWLTDFYLLHVLITTGIFIIAAMSLNLLLGYTGQLSLGHVAFFGIGAYTSALVSLGFEVHVLPDVTVGMAPKPVWFAMLCAVVVAGLTGYAHRQVVVPRARRLFRDRLDQLRRGRAAGRGQLGRADAGSDGAQQHSGADAWLSVRSSCRFCASRRSIFSCSRSAVVCYVIIARLVNSRAGRAMIALRENESLATSVGIDVTRYLVIATVVSAAMAGMAGALYAHYIRIVDPDIFLFIYTVTMVIMVITGGKGTLAGPIVGGVIFGVVPEVLRAMAIEPEVQWIIYGVLMVLVVYFLPRGIVPAVEGYLAGRKRVAGVETRCSAAPKALQK